MREIYKEKKAIIRDISIKISYLHNKTRGVTRFNKKKNNNRANLVQSGYPL